MDAIGLGEQTVHSTYHTISLHRTPPTHHAFIDDASDVIMVKLSPRLRLKSRYLKLGLFLDVVGTLKSSTSESLSRYIEAKG